MVSYATKMYTREINGLRVAYVCRIKAAQSLRSNSAFFAANSSSDRIPWCRSSAKRSMVAQISIAGAGATAGAGGGAAAGRGEAEDASAGRSTRLLAIIGKVATSTTPCWLVKVTVLPGPYCCETPLT
jgi:hypothetical protein